MRPDFESLIKDWPIPKNKKNIQQFLGFLNFYWQFIEGYAEHAKPLTKLTGKELWEWKEEQEKAVEVLKQKVIENAILLITDNTKPFQVETNASDFAIGAILSQPNQQNKWQPVAFISKSISPAKRNYKVYDKEMLAIMHAFDEWSHYLWGVQEQIEVLTDHQNLTYFRKPQNSNRRQAHWVLDLQEYNFVIYIEGDKGNVGT